MKSFILVGSNFLGLWVHVLLLLFRRCVVLLNKESNSFKIYFRLGCKFVGRSTNEYHEKCATMNSYNSTGNRINHFWYLQFTINSKTTDTLSFIPLLARIVKFWVSVHFACCMWNVAVDTYVCILNISVPRYQDTFDRGLLEISRFRDTVELSLTISSGIFSIEGWSEWYKISINVNFPIKN